MNRDKIIGLLALLSFSLIGGAVSPSLIRLGVAALPPFTFNLLRASIALVVLLPIIYRSRHSFSLSTTWLVIGMAGVGLGVNQLFFSLGINHTTIVASQLIYSALPIVVPVLAYILIRERYNTSKLAGTLLSFIGLLIMMLSSRESGTNLTFGTLYGNGLIFTGMFGYATYVAVSKKYTQKYGSWLLSGFSNLGLALFFAPFAGYEHFYADQMWSIDLRLSVVIVAAAISSLLFLWLLQVAISKLSSTSVAMSGLISPIFGAFSGILFFGEHFSWLLFLSMSLVFSGVLLSIAGERQKTFWDKVRSYLRIG